MREDGRYFYWKLREDYFEGDTIVLMESAQDGALYENILLKLCVKSLRFGGELRMEDGTPLSPQMLAVMLRQQVGTVERALKLFHRLGFAEPLPDGTWYMTPVENMIGRSSLEGDRKRKARNAHRYGTEQRGHPSGQGTGSHNAGKNHAADRHQDSGQMSARLSDNRPDICPQGGQQRQTEEYHVEQAHSPLAPPMPDRSPAWGDFPVLGKFRNVCLTPKELSDLRQSFGSLTDTYIERLSRYMHSSGKTYSSHADTLRKWMEQDTAPNARPGRNALPGYDHDYRVEEGETV